MDPRTFPVALLQVVENAVEYAGMFKRIAKDVSGTGLGLAIAKQIVDVHGYRIWAESEGPGKGGAFVIDFGTLE